MAMSVLTVLLLGDNDGNCIIVLVVLPRLLINWLELVSLCVRGVNIDISYCSLVGVGNDVDDDPNTSL